MRGDEHSSGKQGVSVNLQRISVAAKTLDVTPKAADLSVPTRTCRCSRVLSGDSMPEKLTLPRQTSVNLPPFWLF